MMACDKQKELADFIKTVHTTLRNRAKEIGHEEAWKEHIQNKSILNKYASAMEDLAVNYWDCNNSELKDKKCRVQWVVNACQKYFREGGKNRELERERKRYFRMKKMEPVLQNRNDDIVDKLKLLDVGSCYDPFRNIPLFSSFAIDIAPAAPSVIQFDFINATVEYNLDSFSKNSDNILPGNYFDVVLFSLFLEYLPSCIQRYKSCQTAYSCLKPEGLLVIITPDSNHATSNAPLMKEWRLALNMIGFERIFIEKLPHLYCMVFRKNFWVSEARNVVENPASLMLIHQEKKVSKLENCNNVQQSSLSRDENSIIKCFSELPDL